MHLIKAKNKYLYKKREKLLLKDNGSELVSILKKNGTMFFKKIENDSKLKNLHDRFNNYRSTNYNSQYWDGTKNLKTSYY